MFLNFLTIFVGVILVVALSDVIVRRSIHLADHFHLSGTFIGLTLLSIGTSIPEIMTHVVGSFDILREPESMNTLSGLLIGTNIGSDIFQQNFVLPLVGLIGVIVVKKHELVVEIGAMILASILVWVLSIGGFLTRLEGLLLILAYLAYLLHLAKANHFHEQVIKHGNTERNHVFLSLTLIFFCFIVIALATNLIVDAAVKLITLLPLSASLFGVIVLGVASALPELTTALVSIHKGQKAISAGILIGSNITNPLIGIGLGALISEYTVASVIILYDLPIKVATAALLFWFLMRKEDLNKTEAITLILLFFAYLMLRNTIFPHDFPGL